MVPKIVKDSAWEKKWRKRDGSYRQSQSTGGGSLALGGLQSDVNQLDSWPTPTFFAVA
jgi:hypothetical protein